MCLKACSTVSCGSNTPESKIRSLFLTQNKHMQTHNNAVKSMIKYRVNCDTVRPGRICLWQLNSPKISILESGSVTWVASPRQATQVLK